MIAHGNTVDRGWRWLTIVQVACALGLILVVVGRSELRGLICAVAAGLGRMPIVLPSLLAVDGAATGHDAMVLTLAFGFIVLPPLRFFLRSPRRRWVWIPVWLSLLMMALALAPLGMALWSKRVALIVTALVGWFLAARPPLQWMAFVPMAVATHPTLTVHGGGLADWFWSPTRLASRCAQNDGVRPSNFSIDKANTHNYAVTPIDDDVIVLTGERGSYRLRRGSDGRFAFDRSYVFVANLWQGSIGEGRLFYTHSGSGLISVPFEELEREGRFDRQQIPPLPGAPPELDLLDAVYEPTTRSVFLTEMVRGGAWEVPLTGGEMRYHDLGAFYLQMVRRNRDAMLVGVSTTELFVFDPRRKVVTERTAAALGSGGLDVCQSDGAVVVADYAGRLRLFEIGPSGLYMFVRGVSLSSPRRVAFSPDCDWIATSSGDDETAYVLRRRDLSVWREFHMGPALRDVVYTGPREVSIVDACTVNLLPGGET